MSNETQVFTNEMPLGGVRLYDLNDDRLARNTISVNLHFLFPPLHNMGQNFGNTPDQNKDGKQTGTKGRLDYGAVNQNCQSESTA